MMKTELSSDAAESADSEVSAFSPSAAFPHPARLPAIIHPVISIANHFFNFMLLKYKMQRAVDYIRQNYRKPIDMAEVSNHVSMNYSMFSYAFKQYTGQNFVNYLKELRVQEAKRLLARTDMRVIDISRRVGYENEKHFMKTFKSLCGVSPTAASVPAAPTEDEPLCLIKL